MSLKVKFSSGTSTPAKAKLPENLLATVSPIKGNKYKNFLASVLTPSQTKKWLKKKKSNKGGDLIKENKHDAEGVYKGSQISDEDSEPAYSSIQDLQLKQSSYQGSVLDSSSAQSAKFSETVNESSSQLLCHQELESRESLYATVNKQKKTKNVTAEADDEEDVPHKQKSNEKGLSEVVQSRLENKNADALNKNLIDEQREEIKLLVERMKELTAENRELHKNIERIIREEKWKEDSLHAELKLKISQLEADTHKEVKCLSDQIKTLLSERKVLTDQIHILHEEKQLLQVKYEDACSKIRGMVSQESLKEVVQEHEKLLNQIKKKHVDNIRKVQLENESTLKSKISLMGEVEELREQINMLISKNESLKNSEHELLLEKNRILLQLEESRQMQHEAQNMLLSLLKITETISIERDVLINKASFQDHQQKLLQTSIVDYSLNMGRLQEHFSNLSRERSEELQKLKSGESQRDESLKNFYGKQLEILRSKVLNQSNTINDLESEKSKLELQLESLWQAACTGKSKLEDTKFNISTFNS